MAAIALAAAPMALEAVGGLLGSVLGGGSQGPSEKDQQNADAAAGLVAAQGNLGGRTGGSVF